jgi:hypothetical protein
MQRALVAFRSPDLSEEEGLRWLWPAIRTARDVWDDETWEVLVIRFLRLVRETGALSALSVALTARVAVHVVVGELAAAAALVEEVETVIEATGPLAPYGTLMLAASRDQARPAAAHCWPTAGKPRATIGRRSTALVAPASAGSSPAPICSSANGCAARVGGWMRASRCAPPTRCSLRWGWTRSPGVPSVSCRPPARPSASALWKPEVN